MTTDIQNPTPVREPLRARILRELQYGPVSGYSLAARMDAPAGSVRRAIQELRRLGHSITTPDYDDNYYRILA